MLKLILFKYFLHHSTHDGSQVQHADYQMHSNSLRQKQVSGELLAILSKTGHVMVDFSIADGFMKKAHTMYQAIP